MTAAKETLQDAGGPRGARTHCPNDANNQQAALGLPRRIQCFNP
jgi:hypothetical protein